MNRKTFSLSFLSTFSFLAIVFSISIAILVWIYVSTQKIVNYNINEYFKQTNNITKIVLNSEKNKLNDTAFEISNIIKDINEVEKFENEISNITSTSQIDLLFFIDNKGIKDLSNTLFDTQKIIEKILNIKTTLDNIVLGFNIDNEHYLILLSKKKIIDFNTGRVNGTLYVGKILNDNFSFINNIKKSASLENVYIFYKENLIVTSSNKFIVDLKVFDINSIYENDNFIFSKSELPIFNDEKIEVVVSIKNNTFNFLKEEFRNIGYILIVFVIFAFIIFYLISNRFIIRPFSNLLEFAKKAKNNKNVTYVDSKVLEFNNFARDLKSIIDELRDVKEQYSRAIEGVQDGLWDINLVTNTIYCSNRYLQMLGYDTNTNRYELDFWRNSVHKGDYKKTLKKLSQHLNGKSSMYEDDYRFKCADGSYKWIKIRGKVFYDEYHTPIRMTGFHTDIDEFVKLQNENIKKEQMLYQQAKLASMGEMIGNIAHQWRQPLNVISTAASTQILEIDLDVSNKEDIKKSFKKIIETVKYLSDIIENFRNFYNPSKEQEEFYLDEAVSENFDMLSISYKTYNIEFINNVEHIKLSGFKFELVQVILNLINNAKDAILLNLQNNEKRIIFIKSDLKNNYLKISVKDNAKGVKESIKDKIYEPYFTTKHKSQGTGLGLYMSSEIIKKHFNGSLENYSVEYKYKGEKYIGEEFVITIPLKDK